MHNNSKLVFEKHAISYFKSNFKVLEIGPHIPSHYHGFLKNAGIDIKQWEFADIVSSRSDVYSSKLDYIMKDEYSVQVDDNCFDVVFSAQVFEHVRKPWVWIKELARILKPGGLLITISPVSWPYHEAPFDCWRAHPEGMKSVLEDSGLIVVKCVSECLETDKKIIPGKGLDFQGPQPRGLFSNILTHFGYPIEASIDLISIARK